MENRERKGKMKEKGDGEEGWGVVEGCGAGARRLRGGSVPGVFILQEKLRQGAGSQLQHPGDTLA